MNNPFEYPGFRVLAVFFDDPHREFYLREVAKTAGVGSGTAKRFLDFYEANGFVVKGRKANLVLFKGNLENHSFRFMKLGLFMFRAKPLTDFLKEACPGSSVVLYGSCARGEDGPESDVDLLIVGRGVEAEGLLSYEKTLGKRITLLTYSPREWEERARKDAAFYERILADGVSISGGLPVVTP
ncbi:MAG TPA: nucleotidyltransferase domain-containing protein [Candidatus Bathyarchaeia archaeon]